MDIVAMQVTENRRNLKMTVLYRKGGIWYQEEINNLTEGLVTEVSGHPQHPEHLVLFGHYTKDVTLKALGGGLAYTVTQIVGTGSKELPFIPGFA